MKTYSADVVVCGAGTAGLPAALQAARAGCSVLLIEEDAQIGGAPTDQFIKNYCGNPKQGVFKEILEAMHPYAPVSRNIHCFRHSSFILAWTELFRDLPVQVVTGQEIRRAETENGRLIAVESETCRFEGEIFIDATGDGDVAALSGCPFHYGREAADEYGERFAPKVRDNKVQQCTLMYTVRRMPGTDGADANWAVLDNEEFLIWGPTVSCEDTTDAYCVRRAQEQAMAQMAEHSRNWEKKGYYITDIAPRIGVRESRRIIGQYTLNYPDMMAKKSHPDSFAVVNYPVDPWDPEGNPMHDDEDIVQTPSYEIPYRCLVNDTIENLLVAGRCISSTHIANSSVRVMGIVLIIGQAAGNAAALAVRDSISVRDISTEELREQMRTQGVRVSLLEPQN